MQIFTFLIRISTVLTQISHRLMLILACFLASTTALKGQQIPLRHIDIADGLPTSKVYMGLEDRDGYIWFATTEGVARYDGYSFKNFSMRDGLPNNDVFKVQEDGEGRIWVFSFAEGLTYIQNDTVYHIPYQTKHKLFFNSVQTDQRGDLWLNSPKGGLVWNGKTCRLFGIGDDWHLSREYVLKEREGVDWYISRNVLERQDANGIQGVHVMDSTYLWIVVSNNGNCLLHSYNNSLYLFNPGKGVFRSIDWWELFPGQEPRVLGQGAGIHRTQSSVFYSDNGNLLLDDNFLLWNLPAPLDSKQTGFAFRDRSENAWYCVEGDGVWFEPANAKWVQNFGANSGLSHKHITALLRTPKGALLLGMENGDINVFRNGEVISKIETPRKKRIEAIGLRLRDRIMVAGRSGASSFRLREDEQTTDLSWYNPGYKLDSSIGFLVTKKGREEYLAGSVKSVIWDGDSVAYMSLSFTSVKEQEAKDGSLSYTTLGQERILAMAMGPEGTIYEGTTNGLQLRSLQSLSVVEEFDAMRGKYITALANVGDSLLFIGTDGEGIFLNYQNTFSHIPELRQRSIRGVIYDERLQELWIASDQGAWMLKPDPTNPRAYTVQVISKRAGILSPEINAIVPTDSFIYLGTPAGLSIVDRRFLDWKEPLAPLYITQVMVEGIPVPLQDVYELEHDENDLEIGFVGLTYAEKGSQKYAYRLRGVDRKWRETTSLEVNYPQLSPGNYRFEVMLINDRQEPLSQVSNLDITVRPYWADTWWFRIVFVLGLLLLLGMALKWRFDFVRRRDRIASENALQIFDLEARALNAQMNPHFIFNSLNAIQYLMNAREKDKANIYLANFGKLIRMNLEAAEQSTILLQEELDRLAYYLSLESLRLPGMISYDIVIDPGVKPDEVQVPCMILQPFVENAIWHGILPAQRPGKIHIGIAMAGADQLRIIIRDDGIGMEQSLARKKNTHTSKGIELVRRRLELTQRSVKELVLTVSEIKSPGGEALGTEVEIFIGVSSPDPAN